MDERWGENDYGIIELKILIFRKRERGGGRERVVGAVREP